MEHFTRRSGTKTTKKPVKETITKKKSTIQKKKLFNLFKSLINDNNKILSSMNKSYKDSYTKKIILGMKNTDNVNVIGMGGSTLGAKAIYNFLKHKIKKSFIFINNLSSNINLQKNKKIFLNLIVSKSGNTLETISNVSILTNRNDKNVFSKKRYINQSSHRYRL